MFPLLYHTHHNLHLEDLPFWMQLAARQGNPILELGCGTGRVLIPLSQEGYRMYGIDSDAEMLSTLRSLLGPALPGVSLVQADMATFSLDLAFALILLPCNTLSTLSTEVRQATLANVRRHLRPGGYFAASLPNPTLLARMPRRGAPEIEEVFPHPLDGEAVQASSEWRRTSTQFLLTWHYDHLLPDGRLERTSARVCHTLLPVAGYRAALETAGLKVEALYGDYDASPYTEEAPYCIFVCQ